MIKIDQFDSYPGGKSGNGTYQTIINLIPLHKLFCSLFAGNCAITRYIRPAKMSIINDIDGDVISAWRETTLPSGFTLMNFNAIDLLRSLIAENYDTAATFIYLDPPYLMETRRSKVDIYNHEMSLKDHKLFLSVVTGLKNAKIMISHYPNELYNDRLEGWETFDFYSKTRAGMALERLYMNYTPTNELHDYSFAGKNFREREKYKRIRVNMIDKLSKMEPVLRNQILQDIYKLNF